MSDDTEVEVTGTPEETPIPDTVSPPPLEPSSTPITEPDVPAAVPTPTDTPAGEPVVPTEAPSSEEATAAPPEIPVANVVETPPEPTPPPPPPPTGEGVADAEAADNQARVAQAQREAAAFALSTNTPAPQTILPPPLAGVADVPANPIPEPSPTAENSIWICVTEEGPRTSINGVICPVFAVVKLPPQGKLIACPTCGGTSVRRATEEEQRLPQTAVA